MSRRFFSFVFFTRSTWLLVLSPTNPVQTTNISSRFFRRRGEGCHFRFRAPANYLASTFLPLVSSDLRLLSTNICWYPLCDLHSFLMVTFLTGCHCSFQQEDSINLISIVSVGYHVTTCTGCFSSILPSFLLAVFFLLFLLFVLSLKLLGIWSIMMTN